MVNIGISIGRNGFQDWLLQRISAVILTFYILFLFIYFYLHAAVTYEVWYDLFSKPGMKVATFFALLSLIVHSWIGILTVITDYIKITSIKLIIEILVILSLILFLIWGINILWSI